MSAAVCFAGCKGFGRCECDSCERSLTVGIHTAKCGDCGASFEWDEVDTDGREPSECKGCAS